MDAEEPTLLHEPDLMAALLCSADPDRNILEAAESWLRQLLAQAGEDADRVDWKEVRRRLETCLVRLVRAGVLEPLTSVRYRLTARGRQLMEETGGAVDETALMAFPEYRAFVAEHQHRRTGDDREEDVFLLGMNAFRRGLSPLDNPFPSDTADHLAWENGWFAAHDEAGISGGS